MWQELNQLTAELCYRLDAEHVVPQGVLDAGNTAAGLDHGITARMQPTSELVLTTLIQQHIDGINAIQPPTHSTRQPRHGSR